MTHLPISSILNALELMTRIEIQGCLDDSFSDDDISVASNCSIFSQEGSPAYQQIATADHSQNVTRIQKDTASEIYDDS